MSLIFDGSYRPLGPPVNAIERSAWQHRLLAAASPLECAEVLFLKLFGGQVAELVQGHPPSHVPGLVPRVVLIDKPDVRQEDRFLVVRYAQRVALAEILMCTQFYEFDS